METPPDLLYTSSHEWIRVDDGIGTIGITDFAQSELGDVVFVELPAPGGSIARGEPFGVIESVKAAVDLVAPVGGVVLERNAGLMDAPEAVNTSPYRDGWMITIRLSDPRELDELLDAAQYAELLAGEQDASV